MYVPSGVLVKGRRVDVVSAVFVSVWFSFSCFWHVQFRRFGGIQPAVSLWPQALFHFSVRLYVVLCALDVTFSLRGTV